MLTVCSFVNRSCTMKSFFIDTCEKTMFPTEYQNSLFIHWPQCFILNITQQIQVNYLCDEKGFSLRFVFSICRYYNQVKGSESLTAKYFLTYDIFKQLIQFFLFEYYADTNQSVWLPVSWPHIGVYISLLIIK